MVRQSEHDHLEVVEAPEDCGNAPRKIVIRDFLIALYQRDENEVINVLHDDVQWQIVGSQKLNGFEEVRQWLRLESPPRKLHIAMVITHGTDCGADGWVVHPDGSTTGFSHVMIFVGP